MLSKLAGGPPPAVGEPIFEENADFYGLPEGFPGRLAGEHERDAVQVANPQKLIWTRVVKYLVDEVMSDRIRPSMNAPLTRPPKLDLMHVHKYMVALKKASI